MMPRPRVSLEALCLCGHLLSEHVPSQEEPERTCALSRKLGCTEPEIDTTAPCDCAGFVPPLLRVAP